MSETVNECVTLNNWMRGVEEVDEASDWLDEWPT